MTLTEFLEARLAEDEAAARAVVPLGHNLDMGGNRQDEEFSHGRRGRASEDGMSRRLPDGGAAAHFARHDPARVLRDVAAKRRLLRAYKDQRALNAQHHAEAGQLVEATYLVTLRLIASIYSDHPDFREEWA